MALRVFEHVEVVLHGTFGAGDVWSIGFQYSDNLAPGTVWSPGEVDNLTTNANTFALSDIFTTGNVSSWWEGGAAYVGARGYAYHANAHAAFYTSLAETGGRSTTGGWECPNQVALVASLRTGTAGRAYRGRVYVPMLITLNGRASSTQCTQVSNGIASWLQHVRDGSSRGQFTVGQDSAAIELVRVDDVPDTQRRRRDKVSPVSSIDTPVSLALREGGPASLGRFKPRGSVAV